LPKFNDGTNPFLPKTPAAPAEPQKAEITAPPVAPVQKAPPPYAFKPVRSAPQMARTPAAAKPEAARPARSRWTARLNPFRAAEPVAAPVPAVVQPELSLDSVKVVHNDLADAEVEVVPVKAHSDAVVTPPLLPPSRQAWEYVGENLMKS
jgi:hypothetical protein